MARYFYIWGIILCSFSFINAQKLSEHNLYHYNLTHINPASAAFNQCKQFVITDRHQWTGIENAPCIQSLSAQFPVEIAKDRKYGYGINIIRDQNGAYKTLGGEFLYAYHISLNTLKPQTLSFGLSGRIEQTGVDESDFNSALFDPEISYTKNYYWNYDAAFGIFMYGENYYAGYALYNILPGNKNLNANYKDENFLSTLIFEYDLYSIRYNVKIAPSAYFIFNPNLSQLDFTTKVYFVNGLWSGISFRNYSGNYYQNGKNLLLFLGYIYLNWDIAYTYDLGLNGMQKNHYGSHQLSLTYYICRKKYACPVY